MPCTDRRLSSIVRCPPRRLWASKGWKFWFRVGAGRSAIQTTLAWFVVLVVSTVDDAWCQTAPSNSTSIQAPPSLVAKQTATFAAGVDPRDAKLRELEARLAETERRLDEAAGINRRQSTSPGTDHEAAAFPGKTVSATVVQQGDTNRDFEERLQALSGKVQKVLDLKNSFPSVKITGFTQLDGAWYSQDPLNRATVGDMQDGVGFRRARLAFQGYAAEFTFYQLEVDFASAGRPSFFDTYVEQQNLPIFGNIRAGQYLQPFSVDAMSGFRNLPFLERSLPFLAFVPFRRVGVMASSISETKRTQWAYSAFRTGGFNNAPLGDSRFGTDFGNTGGYSFSTRTTQLMYYDEPSDGRYLWHIGGGYDFSQLGANTAAGSTSNVPFYQARTGPEFFLGYPENVPATFGPSTAFAGTPNFVDTGRYKASNFNLWGLETVAQYGPVSFQAEWMATQVNSAVGPIFYNGAYAEVMYRLTGEHRQYDRNLGSFRNFIPFTDFFALRGPERGVHGWGGWEIAARWSYVDLRNPASLNKYYIGGTNASGNGILNDSTVGLSWHMNAHTKLQFNWIHAMLNNTAKGHSQADLFVTRAQVDF